MGQGKLVVVEGACDGIGKSTQYKLLGDRLSSDGEDVVLHHFPSYGTIQGALVERYLSGEFGDVRGLSPYFVNSLYAMDRAITWKKELEPQISQGKVVLLDRYTTSSLIYQSALLSKMGEKFNFIDYVCDYEYKKLGIKMPDLVVFLYASFDVVTDLRNRRSFNEGISNDIHEKDVEFMKKVYDNSLDVAKYLGWDLVMCDDGIKMRSISDIHEDVYRLVKKRM